jgi:hypothetical protein
MGRFIVAMAVSLIALIASTASRADNPLNFYLGVASGSANVRLSGDHNINTLLYNGFHQNDVGWKVFVCPHPRTVIRCVRQSGPGMVAQQRE